MQIIEARYRFTWFSTLVVWMRVRDNEERGFVADENGRCFATVIIPL